MKKILLIIILISSLAYGNNFQVYETTAATTEVKIMTYNIEESGINPDWKQVVKEENPDIVVFVETGAWDDNNDALMNQYLDEFNNYFTTEDPYVGNCAQDILYETSGECVFSRFPIINTIQIPLVTLDDGTIFDVSHDFMDWTITINTVDTHVFGAHLKCCAGDPTNEDKRNKQQEGMINYMDDLGNVPIIYMGDLNSFSPVDVEDPNLAPDRDDLGVGPMTMMVRPDDPTYGQYSSSIHQWNDVFRELNPNDPGYTFGYQSNNLDGRIDFIVTNQYFTLDQFTSSTVGDTPTADTGSDHYTVDATLNIGVVSSDTTPPSQVTGLNATAISSSQIDLSWNSVPDTDLSYYKIYRDGVFIDTTTQIIYSDLGLTQNTTYSYEVSAVDTSGNEGIKSDPVSATTLENTGTTDYIYVDAINWDQDYIRGRKSYYRLEVFIRIMDSNGNLVIGATVTIDWTKPDGITDRMSVLTDSNGIAYFKQEPADTGTHTVTVIDVVGDLTYDPTFNIETTDSYVL